MVSSVSISTIVVFTAAVVLIGAVRQASATMDAGGNVYDVCRGFTRVAPKNVHVTQHMLESTATHYVCRDATGANKTWTAKGDVAFTDMRTPQSSCVFPGLVEIKGDLVIDASAGDWNVSFPDLRVVEEIRLDGGTRDIVFESLKTARGIAIANSGASTVEFPQLLHVDARLHIGNLPALETLSLPKLRYVQILHLDLNSRVDMLYLPELAHTKSVFVVSSMLLDYVVFPKLTTSADSFINIAASTPGGGVRGVDIRRVHSRTIYVVVSDRLHCYTHPSPSSEPPTYSVTRVDRTWWYGLGACDSCPEDPFSVCYGEPPGPKRRGGRVPYI